MNRLLLFLIGFSVLFASCDKENPTPTESTLNVRFLLNYGGQPLVFNQNQAYANGDFIKLGTFHYFLSGLNIRNGADSVKLADLSYVDFGQSNTTLGGATGGLQLSIPKVKTGDYTSLEFGIGLPAAVNATKPADYPSNHPLADAGNYWAGWNGYIFSKMEGKVDSVANGVFASGFTFHTGLDPYYRVVKLKLPFEVDGLKAANTVTVSLDLKKLFVLGGQPIDLFEISQAHGPANEAVISGLVNNYQSAFSIQL